MPSLKGNKVVTGRKSRQKARIHRPVKKVVRAENVHIKRKQTNGHP